MSNLIETDITGKIWSVLRGKSQRFKQWFCFSVLSPLFLHRLISYPPLEKVKLQYFWVRPLIYWAKYCLFWGGAVTFKVYLETIQLSSDLRSFNVTHQRWNLGPCAFKAKAILISYGPSMKWDKNLWAFNLQEHSSCIKVEGGNQILLLIHLLSKQPDD